MIIGVCGLAGSGKGTVADILVEKYGYQKLSFADTLKDVCSVMFGWNRALLEGDTEVSRKFRECPDAFWTEKFGRDFTPREALQKLGTECGRNVFHEDFWVHTLEHRMNELTKTKGTLFVIPDVRFPNEINFIRENGGKIICVKRGTDPGWLYDLERLHEGKSFNGIDPEDFMYMYHPKIHYSEWAWVGSGMDFTISNIGTIDQLEDSVKKVLTYCQ